MFRYTKSLGFKRFHRNVDIKYLKKSENSEKNKIMIRGIHYFITTLKRKIDVIPRSCFNLLIVSHDHSSFNPCPAIPVSVSSMPKIKSNVTEINVIVSDRCSVDQTFQFGRCLYFSENEIFFSSFGGGIRVINTRFKWINSSNRQNPADKGLIIVISIIN